jgi:hypothetical protein
MARTNEDKLKKNERKLKKIAKKQHRTEKKILAKELKRQKKIDKAKSKSDAKAMRPHTVVPTPTLPVVPQVTPVKPIAPVTPIVSVVKPRAGVQLTKALLIGINYNGTDSQLSGCINDMDNLSQKLVSLNLVKKQNIIFMTDNLGGAQYPTKANILTQFDNLVQYAVNNPTNPVQLVIAYSGHGTYMKDTNNDEEDGVDEALCPVDYSSKGFIVDDDLNQRVLTKLPANAQLVMLIDACHSGTMGDLKYNYNIDGLGSVKVSNSKSTMADIVMVSGCTDSQTSADAYIYDPTQKRYEYQGAMTAAFLATFQLGISSSKLIKGMREWLAKAKMTQTVQMSSGKSLIPMAPFLLTKFRA